MREFILADGGAEIETSVSRRGDRLPTREQLDLVVDLEWFVSFRDKLDREITKIETDLEFRPGDEDWAARARGALTAHQICKKGVERRIRQLQRRPGKVGEVGPADEEAKLRIKEARRLAHEAHLAQVQQAKQARQKKKDEVSRQIQEAQRIKKAATNKQQTADTIRNANFAAHFIGAAKELLDAVVYDSIIMLASERQAKVIAEIMASDPFDS